MFSLDLLLAFLLGSSSSRSLGHPLLFLTVLLGSGSGGGRCCLYFRLQLLLCHVLEQLDEFFAANKREGKVVNIFWLKKSEVGNCLDVSSCDLAQIIIA